MAATRRQFGAGLPAGARNGKKYTYGRTTLVQATADSKSRRRVFADYENHAYFGRLSSDDKYLIFSTDRHDGLIVGDMHIIRMADTPMIRPGFEAIKELYPDAKEGPILDLRLPTGA